MSAKEILLQIATLAKQNNIHEPYIVGGLPRDKVLGIETEINDIDLTTGYLDIQRLAKLTAAHFQKQYPKIKVNQAPNGYFNMKFANLEFDFASSDVNPVLNNLLRRVNKNPDRLVKECLSRDFTCNTLLATLDVKTIKDPTGMGVRDIKRKLIRTPLPPRISLGDDPRRVVRAVYLSAKLDFDIEEPIIKWALRNHDRLGVVGENYVQKKIGGAFKYNEKRAVAAMDAMKLWDKIPFISDMLPYMDGRV